MASERDIEDTLESWRTANIDDKDAVEILADIAREAIRERDTSDSKLHTIQSWARNFVDAAEALPAEQRDDEAALALLRALAEYDGGQRVASGTMTLNPSPDRGGGSVVIRSFTDEGEDETEQPKPKAW